MKKKRIFSKIENEIEDHGNFITFFGPIIKKKRKTFQEVC